MRTANEPRRPSIAYFSMELALEPRIPTYSGGLGVLAGDTLRSAADLGVPVVAVSLVHRRGYFRQQLDSDGRQNEAPEPWHPEERAELVNVATSVSIEGRRVVVRAWVYRIRGISGHEVPVYLLDTCVPENTVRDRSLTDELYGGDQIYRLCQEVVLGIGGIKLLRRLGYVDVSTFHMNEGHAAFLSIALLEELVGDSNLQVASESDIEDVRRRCVFTTHTPVPAGHDQFTRQQMQQVLGPDRASVLEASRCCPHGLLNMTYLALRFSRYVNGVAMRHGEISQKMFPHYSVHAITNGVHAATWTSQPFQTLFDRYLPGWRLDNHYLRYAVRIPLDDVQTARTAAKQALFKEIESRVGTALDPEMFTIGIARRAAQYKRPSLILSDPDRLARIAAAAGGLQIVFSGKAHPHDGDGKELVRSLVDWTHRLRDQRLKCVYVPNYDMEWGQLLTSGVDLWMNTPLKPQEASGTSGMKAALNGVPSLSVLDGWWVEGCVEGVTGWVIGSAGNMPQSEELQSLYAKLDETILPLFYRDPRAYAAVCRSTIAVNGSFFNTQRMLLQYVTNAYAQ